jgi:hypothetical protein
VSAFAAVAATSVEDGAAAFVCYTKSIGQNFDLAVLNAGDVLFNRVLAHESLIAPEERQKHPGVYESIQAARVIIGPQVWLMGA